MKILFFNLRALFIIIIFQFPAYAGSYMFCGNERLINDINYTIEGIGWNWSKGIINNPQFVLEEK